MRKIYFDNFPSIRYNLMVQCQVKNVENFSHKWHDKHDKHDKHDILLPRHHHGLDDDVCWTDLGQLGWGEDGGDEEGLPPLPPAPRDPGPPEGEELPLLRQWRQGGRMRSPHQHHLSQNYSLYLIYLTPWQGFITGQSHGQLVINLDVFLTSVLQYKCSSISILHSVV